MGSKHVLVHLDEQALEQVVPGDRLARARVRPRHAGRRSPRARLSQPRPGALDTPGRPPLRDGGIVAARHARASAGGRRDGQRPRQRGHVDRAPAGRRLRRPRQACGSATSSPSATGTRRTTPATARESITIGVVTICGDSPCPGNGPGVTLLLSGSPRRARSRDRRGRQSRRAPRDRVDAQRGSDRDSSVGAGTAARDEEPHEGLSRHGRRRAERCGAQRAGASLRSTMSRSRSSAARRSASSARAGQARARSAGCCSGSIRRPPATSSSTARACSPGAALRVTASCASAIQVVFQDPYSSLNPTMTVRQTLGRC